MQQLSLFEYGKNLRRLEKLREIVARLDADIEYFEPRSRGITWQGKESNVRLPEKKRIAFCNLLKEAQDNRAKMLELLEVELEIQRRWNA